LSPDVTSIDAKMYSRSMKIDVAFVRRNDLE
jgi:hypothetical protein